MSTPSNTVYDTNDRPLTIVKAYGTPIQQTYATYSYQDGHLASSKDANGNLSTFQVDGFGRLQYQNFPSATNVGLTDTYERYSYDQNDNITQIRKRDGSIIDFPSYDAMNRLLF
jgi:YD repeat-containing protein